MIRGRNSMFKLLLRATPGGNLSIRIALSDLGQAMEHSPPGSSSTLEGALFIQEIAFSRQPGRIGADNVIRMDMRPQTIVSPRTGEER